MCVVCYVDEEMKDKIIAYGAEFHKVTKSPYGRDDEIGMLHLIDAKSRSAIMSRADASKVLDLSVDNFVGMPGWFGAGDQPYQIWMTHTPGGEIVANSMGASLEANGSSPIQATASLCTRIAGPTSIPSTISDTTERFSTSSAPKSISAAAPGPNAGRRSTRQFSPEACCSISQGCRAPRSCRQATASARGPEGLPEEAGPQAATWGRRPHSHRADDALARSVLLRQHARAKPRGGGVPREERRPDDRRRQSDPRTDAFRS